MGFLRRNDNAKPDYTALEIQTSTSILPIPIVWGQNKLAPNVLWYANFRAGPGRLRQGHRRQGRPDRRRGSSASANYTYYADLIMGLCEGPINGDRPDLKDSSIYLAARTRAWMV